MANTRPARALRRRPRARVRGGAGDGRAAGPSGRPEGASANDARADGPEVVLADRAHERAAPLELGNRAAPRHANVGAESGRERQADRQARGLDVRTLAEALDHQRIEGGAAIPFALT